MEKIAFLFPGQGSQYIGMGKSLYDQYDIVKNTYEEATDVLGFDLAKLCFDGSLLELSKMENAFVSLLASSVASFRVYMKEIGVTPCFCAGHSLGEYSALVCSGMIQFSDALKIVKVRSMLAKEVADNANGAMTIIDGISRELIEDECKRISSTDASVWVSCYNSSSQFAISGEQAAVQKVEDIVLDNGGQITPLFGSAPFHSPMMAEAAKALKEEMMKYTFYSSRYPVISNISVTPYSGAESVADNLMGQLVKPVRWLETMDYLKNWGITLAIEIGPKNVLSNLINLEKEINAAAFDQREERNSVFELLSKPEYKKHVPNVITKCLAIAVSTENSCFDSEYENGVVMPYRRIQEIHEAVEKNGEPSTEQMLEALKLLETILNTKQVPKGEQKEWFRQLYDETGTNYLFNNFGLE